MTNYSSYIEKINKLILKLEELDDEVSKNIQPITDLDIRNVITNLNSFKTSITRSIITENSYYKFTSPIDLFLNGLKFIDEFDLENLKMNNYSAHIKSLVNHSKNLIFFDYQKIGENINIKDNFIKFKKYFSICLGIWSAVLVLNIIGLVIKNSETLLGSLFLIIIVGISLFYYLDKKFSAQTKLDILGHIINYPNPNLKTQDKLVEFLLQDLKSEGNISQPFSSFQKYIKAK